MTEPTRRTPPHRLTYEDLRRCTPHYLLIWTDDGGVEFWARSFCDWDQLAYPSPDFSLSYEDLMHFVTLMLLHEKGVI